MENVYSTLALGKEREIVTHAQIMLLKTNISLMWAHFKGCPAHTSNTQTVGKKCTAVVIAESVIYRGNPGHS